MTGIDAMPDIEVSPTQWHIVAEILRACLPNVEVWAFGSRAKRKAKPFSDLDLAVITSEPLALAVHAELAERFSESDLPWKVDIVDWASTSDVFQRVIANDKVVVQHASS